MKSRLTELILAEYKDSSIVKGEKEKYCISGIGFDGIDVEIMPNNSNEFVLRFNQLEFFGKDELQNYLKHKLRHNDVNFMLSTWRVYVYVNKNRDDMFRFQVFKYTLNETLIVLNAILEHLNSVNK